MSYRRYTPVRRDHSHPCFYCKADTPCPGTFEFNYDGDPECWCDVYHSHSYDFECEDCTAAREAQMEWDHITRAWVAPKPDVDEQTLWGV